MATGKELVRMMICGNWDKYIKKRKDFCSAQIYNDAGKPISLKTAAHSTYCHVRILFKGCPEDSLHLMAGFLRTIASTNSEQMVDNVFTFYGFGEIIIS